MTHVRSEEFSDIRTYNAPDVVRYIMGFGVSPEEAMAGPIVELLGAGFKASVRMIVAEMGFDADPELESVQEVAVATAPLDTPSVSSSRVRSPPGSSTGAPSWMGHRSSRQQSTGSWGGELRPGVEFRT